MTKPLAWVVFAANVCVVVVALSSPALVVPLAVVAALLALALPFVSTASAPAAPAPESAAPASAGPVSVPQNYELRERIASGTMGEVWLARHTKLGRDAAYKRIKPGNIDDEDKRRFEREARVLANLRSPHTVEVFDFGLTPAGELFYAMEFLDGIDLQTAVREHGPFPPERVIHLLLQVCASLSEAHAQGLVHRDVKPSNFMICRYGGEFDFLKVLDFGLVKKPTAEASAMITNPATVLGTPAFLAPESMSGSKFVDGRADLYALGASAFWLLTARLVFLSDRPLEMVKMHLTEPPPRVSAHSRFEIPGALDSLIFDCLQKKPDDRPSSADVVRSRLEAIPLATRWDRERSAAWWNEHMGPPKAAAGRGKSS